MCSCATNPPSIDFYYEGSLYSDVFLTLNNSESSYVYCESDTTIDYKFKEFGTFHWCKDTCFLYPKLLITESSIMDSCRNYSSDDSYYETTDSTVCGVKNIENRVFIKVGKRLEDQSLYHYFKGDSKAFSCYEQVNLLKQDLRRIPKCR